MVEMVQLIMDGEMDGEIMLLSSTTCRAIMITTSI